jgi:hypothetical protein
MQKSSRIVKDYTVFNPDFYKDVVRFMALKCSDAEAESRITKVDGDNRLTSKQEQAGALSLKQRLNALVDRIEFIHHLDILSRFAVQSDFVILNEEVRGIHWDIRALRVYLALTCIDIFREDDKHNAKDYFERVFTELNGAVRKLVDDTLSLEKQDGTTGNLEEELGLFFYNVRNFYTHSGLRFHILDATQFRQEARFLSGSIKHKQEQYLVIEEHGDVVKVLLDIGISIARKRFGWETE